MTHEFYLACDRALRAAQQRDESEVEVQLGRAQAYAQQGMEAAQRRHEPVAALTFQRTLADTFQACLYHLGLNADEPHSTATLLHFSPRPGSKPPWSTWRNRLCALDRSETYLPFTWPRPFASGV